MKFLFFRYTANMSKERGEAGIGDAMRYAAIAVLGLISAFCSENTSPGRWVAEKKRRLKKK